MSLHLPARELVASPPAAIPVAWRDQPFTGKPHQAFVLAGASIADIVATLDLPPSLFRHGIAVIEREGLQWEVPRDRWHLVRPKSGQCTVIVCIRHGRGNGTLALIATIAVVIAAAAIAGPAAGFITGATSGPIFALTSAAIATAITLGGSLAIQALTSVPTLQDPGTASAGTPEAPTGGVRTAALTGNVLRPGGPVARVIGTHRVFPSLACNVLIEAIGDDEVAEAVFALAGPHALSDLRIGNVSIDDLDEADYEVSEGLPDSNIQTLIERYGVTVAAGVELKGHKVDLTTSTSLADQEDPSSDLPQWHSFVSRVAPDEIWITLVWNQGLFITDAPAIATNQAVRVRFRKRGDSTWINCPEVHFSHTRVGTIQKTIRLIWGARPSNPSFPPSGFGPVYAYKTVAAQNVAPTTIGGWTANAYFSAGAGNDLLSLTTYDTSNVANTELRDDRAIFYLDPSTFPQDEVYEVQVMRSQVYKSSDFTPATYLIAGTIYDLFGYYDSSGVHRTINDQSKYMGRVGVGRFSSVWNQNPIETRDFAHIAVTSRNRSLEQLSVLAAGYTYDWDGSGWNTLSTTANPAPHYVDVRAGRLSPDPVPADLIDNDEIVDWRTRCTANGYECHAVVEGRSQDVVLDMIAACGLAKKREAEIFGIISDRDRSADTPVQEFNPRNMAGFRFSRPFIRLPHGLRIRFDNSDDDYREREIVVLDPQGPQDPSSLFLEDRRYDGIVTEAVARSFALREMKLGRLRFKYFTGSVAADILRVRNGDLVGVQHDILAGRAAGYARILEVLTSGSNVVGLRLDGTIPLPDEDALADAASAFSSYSSAFAAPRSGIAIRCLDGSVLTSEITATGEMEATELSFVTPFSDPGRSVLDADCLIQSGPLSSERSRLLVSDIDYRKGGLIAQVTFQPEARELWPFDIYSTPTDIYEETDIYRTT